MEFKIFRDKLSANFSSMTKDITMLYQVGLDKEELWNLYLDSFPPGTNEIYRERREHDCSSCKGFIRQMGNVVMIKDNKIKTIWDFNADSTIFQPVIDALDAYVKSKTIDNIWMCNWAKIGTVCNHEDLGDGTVHTWDHMNVTLPAKFVNKSSRSLGDIYGENWATKSVFKRSLDEITKESVLAILELISANSLYKGEEWKGVLDSFLAQKEMYSRVPDDQKDLYTWEQSAKVGNVIGRIRNHSIGTLLVDVSNDVDLDEAVRKYEAMVAPTNYKRPKAIFTKKMLEDAKKTIEDLGYMTSLERRYATLDDISVSNILFSNKDSAKRVVGTTDFFSDMEKQVSINPKSFSKIEEVTIDNFITNILPTVKELELLFENKHSSNLVSLIAPKDPYSNNMFKWDNRFTWAYSGNITDSLKENVKAAGGKVDGVLRFSIQWNDGDTHDGNDLDAHCIEPSGNHISFRHKTNTSTTGELDVDIISPTTGRPAVENITWSNINRMGEGTYKFFVNNYNNRGGRGGFRAEIEFGGQIYSFDYAKELRQSEDVMVAEVIFNKASGFSIKEMLPSSSSSRSVWDVTTNQFVPVSVLMYSPNYWNQQNGIGHRHYFFMLKDCKNQECPNGFYNEFLKEDLMKHKKVLEALSSRARVEYNDDQLSGIGFSSTKRADIIVKAKGQTERVLRIKI